MRWGDAIGTGGERNIPAHLLWDRASSGGRAAGLLPSVALLRHRLFPRAAEIASLDIHIRAAREYSETRARCGPRSLREFRKLLLARLSRIRNHFCSGRSRLPPPAHHREVASR